MLAICMGSGVPPARTRVRAHDRFSSLEMAMEAEACLGPAESESEVGGPWALGGGTWKRRHPICQAKCSGSRLQPGPSFKIAIVFWSRSKCCRHCPKDAQLSALSLIHCVARSGLCCSSLERKESDSWPSKSTSTPNPRLSPVKHTDMPSLWKIRYRFSVFRTANENSIRRAPSLSVFVSFQVQSFPVSAPTFQTGVSSPDSFSPSSVSREHPRLGLDPLDRVRGRRRSPVDLDLDWTSTFSNLDCPGRLERSSRKISYFLLNPVRHPDPKRSNTPNDSPPLNTHNRPGHPSRLLSHPAPLPPLHLPTPTPPSA